MTFTQECVIPVERERLWDFLMELPRVARCVPGVDTIEVVDANAYRGSLRVQVGPIRLALQGTMTVEERDRSAWRARMRAEANDRRVGGALAHADPNQDPPVTLLALGARVEIRGARGHRELPLDEFFRDYYETALEPGELVTAVTVPLAPAASGATFLKFLPRTADDYATVAVAAIVTLEPDGERCREARIALGAVGVTPLRARAAEAFLSGQRLSESLLQAAGEAVKGAVDPLSDHRGSAAYKREMTAVMVGRALTQAWEAARRPAE